MEYTYNKPSFESQPKNKENQPSKLFKILQNRPISTITAVTELGYPDQTFMVNQVICDFLGYGKPSRYIKEDKNPQLTIFN